MFIERNLLNVFERILDKSNAHLNTQLIQTTSILIQNIHNKEESFYMLSHPFLNKLISYNFDLDENNELVDYFISFLKMLSLKIDSSTIQFFYNKKFCNFPLYGVSISLYNHRESMVRTAARAITLAIYDLSVDDTIDTILSLPHGTYFPNLAWKLRSSWLRIDRMLTDSAKIEDIRDEVEDINDILEYFQDIFNSNRPKLTKALANSLLIYAYYPWLLGSFWMKPNNPEIRSFQAAFFFASQTFSIIKEPMLCNAVAAGLFCSSLPPSLIKWMTKDSKHPKDYQDSYFRRSKSNYLKDFIEENLSLQTINSIYDNQNLLCENNETKREDKLTSLPETEEVDIESIEIKKKRFSFVRRKLTDKELKSVSKYHKLLSLALGRPIGLKEFRSFKSVSPTDLVQSLIKNLNSGDFETLVEEEKYEKNKNPQFILNFLKSKDDGLILIIWSLIFTFWNSQAIDQGIFKNWNMFPIGREKIESFKNQKLELEEEKCLEDNQYLLNLNCSDESKEASPSTNLKSLEYEQGVWELISEPNYNNEVIENLLNLLALDPPFRLTTFKIIANIICDMWHDSQLKNWLLEDHFGKLFNAYYVSVQNIRNWLK